MESLKELQSYIIINFENNYKGIEQQNNEIKAEIGGLFWMGQTNFYF